MKRLLFIVDQLPYPPRNGVTIPSYNIIVGLSNRFEVSLLFLRSQETNFDNESINKMRYYVKNIWVLDLFTSETKLSAIYNEAFHHKPYFYSKRFDQNICKRFLAEYDCDVLWATPISAFSYIEDIHACFKTLHNRLLVAAISDSYTATLRSFGHLILGWGWPLSVRFEYAVKWLRSWWMAKTERILLSKADFILTQTEVDKRWVERIIKDRSKERVHIIPNGVDSNFFLASPPSPRKVFGYIGPLTSPSHSRTVRWIINNVLPKVSKNLSGVTFSVLGREGSTKLMNRLKGEPSIAYANHVDKIENHYRNLPILIIRNYKTIGLINRTVEAMAAGVVVVGERGAFNGIEGFKDGVHGFIAESSLEMANCITYILSNETVRKSVITEARKLISKNFQWSDRIDSIIELIS